MSVDEDLIAYVSCDPDNILVKRLIYAYTGADNGQEEEPYTRDSRESTASLDDEGAELPKMELRFSRGPKTGDGFVFGASTNCDFVLNSKHISNRHFSITFDDLGRLVVRDLHTVNGLVVKYNGKAGVSRKDGFQWIIGGDPAISGLQVEVFPPKLMPLLVESALFNPRDPDHLARVAVFRQGTAPLEECFDDQVLSDRRTALATQSASAVSNAAVYIPLDEIASGGFGIVYRVWNVSTGQLCARKKPLQKLEPRQISKWVRESNCMKTASHDHIVPLIDSTINPVPTIYMEFYHLGSLNNQDPPLNRTESIQILEQCLDALNYLHSIKMAHRDISPPNILVRGRAPTYDNIDVVLSDFGLSKEGSNLVTFCGTQRYRAPEVSGILPSRQAAPVSKKLQELRPTDCMIGDSRPWNGEDKYTCAVDLWSLGVVVLQIAFGLPTDVDPVFGYDWANRLVSEAAIKGTKVGSLGDILRRMIVIDPAERITSRECHSLALDLVLFGDEPTPTLGPVTGKRGVSPSDGKLHPFIPPTGTGGDDGEQYRDPDNSHDDDGDDKDDGTHPEHTPRVFQRSGGPEPSSQRRLDEAGPQSTLFSPVEYHQEHYRAQQHYTAYATPHVAGGPGLRLDHGFGQYHGNQEEHLAARTSQWLPPLESDSDAYMVQGGMGYAGYAAEHHGRLWGVGTARQWHVGQTREDDSESQD